MQDLINIVLVCDICLSDRFKNVKSFFDLQYNIS